MKFSFEDEKNRKSCFLDVEVSGEGNKFATTVYSKPTFSGAHTHFEEEKNGKSCFLDVEMSREGNKFVSTVYSKPTFSVVYTHFDNFLPTTYKFSMIYTLVFRCCSICSNWTNFHNDLLFLKDIFKKWVSYTIHR